MIKIKTIESVWYAPVMDITQNLDMTIHLQTVYGNTGYARFIAMEELE